MTTITTVNDWFLLNNKFLFGASENSDKYINLTKAIWDDMRYKKLEYVLIDYPGEYDVEGNSIRCFVGVNSLLNYLISFDGKRIALIQSPDALENNAEFAVAQEWLYTDDAVLAKLEQLEVEGEKIKLGS